MSKTLLFAVGGVFLAGFIALVVYQTGLVTWNASESLPVGLYVKSWEPVATGAIVRVSPLWNGDVYRLKYVLGDSSTVRLEHDQILAYGKYWGSISPEYKAKHPIPIFGGEGWFLYSPHPRSTDSRYFGFIPASYLLGVYVPLIIDRRPYNVVSIP